MYLTSKIVSLAGTATLQKETSSSDTYRCEQGESAGKALWRAPPSKPPTCRRTFTHVLYIGADSSMSAVDINLTAYRLLFEIETALREFLILRYEPISGPQWYREVLSAALVAKLERTPQGQPPISAVERRAAGDKKGWVSRRAFHPIYFVDFPELGGVFRMKSNSKLGEFLVGKSATAVADHIDRLLPIRNAVAHNRLITSSDLNTIDGIHSIVRANLGSTVFDDLANHPPSQCKKGEEEGALRSELSASAASARAGNEISLSVWNELKQRWWLEPEWQLDADSVRNVFNLLEQYRGAWSEDFLGRRQRVTCWFSKNWDLAVFDRAMASLEHDSGLAGK